jgi:hypothetical protein
MRRFPSMTRLVTDADAETPEAPGRRRRLGALPAAAAIGAVLWFIGWNIPTVGGSVLAPALVVLAIGAVIAAVSLVAAYWRPMYTGLWVFALSVLVLAVVASWWTLDLALPARMAWSVSATNVAEHALSQLRHEPGFRHGVAPAHGCTEVVTGSIGPLPAPYSECPVSTNEGHFVTFSAGPGGLAYTNIGVATFEDQCYRHLEGPWWMYTRESSVGGTCPFGYRFRGGG